MPAAPSERTALYRLYDADSRLLYIGIAKDPAKRWRQHARDKATSWWPDVARHSVEWFSNRAKAEKAEIKAIRAEGPPYNSKHVVAVREPGCTPQASAPSKRVRDHRIAAFDRGARFLRECKQAKISAPELVARKLRERISSGVYPVGSRLPLGEDLRSELGVSNTTLSRGVAILKQEGLLEGRSRQGTFVLHFNGRKAAP